MTLAWIRDSVSQAVNLLLSLVGLEKETAKALLTEWNLIYFWDAARTLLTAPFLFGVLAALLVERVVGLTRSKSLSPSFWQGVWCRALNVLALGGVLAFCLGIVHALYDNYLPFLQVRILDGVPLAVQFVCVLFVGDSVRYAHHRMRHVVPVFWVFHAIHHSDRDLNPATEFRAHIGDRVNGALIHAGPTMLLGGDPLVVSALVFFNEFWNIWLHSDTRITLGWLGKYICSPAFHRIHHSCEPRHFDKNYGNYFCIWDRMLGTAYMNFDEEYDTGIAGYGRSEPTSDTIPAYIANWAWLTVRPFLDIAHGGWRSRGAYTPAAFPVGNEAAARAPSADRPYKL